MRRVQASEQCAVPGHHARGAMVLQTIIFSKMYTKTSVVAWLRTHGYHWAIDEKTETFRARQLDPACFQRKSFRTIEFMEGVKAVVGKLKS